MSVILNTVLLFKVNLPANTSLAVTLVVTILEGVIVEAGTTSPPSPGCESSGVLPSSDSKVSNLFLISSKSCLIWDAVVKSPLK